MQSGVGLIVWEIGMITYLGQLYLTHIGKYQAVFIHALIQPD